ncbi:probable membrane-associated kinase regulator 6 [Prosopis cineraria]|uniref:probable membrane-associated kinase regulator 6 n=1 Tax=Prosopis cineraria TaxID=364024 RepID=UPI00241027DB|nr:probable membrane-associated kinase regulator 6 [Prosopis cineraria]XP_054809090.1 probable membrane-associated kinase regulator 6 [Prosopis cineraria]
MESSLPLATDSFSYSWLSSDFKLPVNGLDEESLRASMNSEGLIMAEPQSFNFDFSLDHLPPTGFVHADELFSDGFIRPVYGDPSKVEYCNTPYSTQSMPSSFFYSGIVSPRSVGTHHHGFLTKWRKSTQKILRSSFGYFKQLCRRVGCSWKSTRVGDFEKTEWEVKSWSISQQASPKSVKAYSMGDLFDYENSIYEAVLHCKKSIGN